MRIQVKAFISLMIQIILLLVSFFFLFRNNGINAALSFTDISKYGTIISALLWAANIWISGTVFSNISFIYLSFVLFQFGIPILYATSETYTNWYLTLFSSEVLISSTIFTIFCIQMFSLGIISSSFFSNRERNLIFSKKSWVQDNEMVVRAGLLLFLFSAIIYFPATLYGAFVLHDRFSLPAIGGLAKQFYFPAAFLLLVYSKNKRLRIFIYLMFFAESIAGMMTGGRTEGLLPFMVFVVYFFEYRNTSSVDTLLTNEKENIKQRNPFRIIGILILLFIVLLLLVYIAQERVGENVSSGKFLNQNIYQLFVGELGFNFTTIQFVMTGIGSIGFQHGQTYLSDIITLIPNALDPTGIITHLQQVSGSNWLQETYGNQLGFGLGFSLVGEAYFNFGYYGMIMMFIFGIIVDRLQSKNPEASTNWEKYVALVILLGMLTVPRRDFYQLIKQIEYSVYFIALYLYLFSRLKKSNI